MSPKAHADQRTRKQNALAGLALGIALLGVEAGTARAAALGDIELRSHLGEHFDARIPIAINEGESMDLACFSLARPESEGPAVTRAQLAVEGEGARASLRIRSNRPWNEPVANLRVRFFCARTGPVTREYALLIDPRGAISVPVLQSVAEPRPVAAPAAAVAATQAAPAPAVAGRLRAVSGDTLASIARAVYPRGRKLQQAFIEALRAANPNLAALPENEPIAEGAEIALPNLRDFANSAVVVEAGRDATPAPTEQATAAPVAPRPGAAKEKKPATPEPRAPVAEKKPAALPPTPKPGPEPTPLRPPASSARAEGGFQLRLSTGDIDLTRSRGMNDEKRDRLRERQLVLDSDDQVAALLALRHSLKQLESRVAEMQLRLTTSAPAVPPTAGKPETKAPAAVAPPSATVPAPVAVAPAPIAVVPAPVVIAPVPVAPSPPPAKPAEPAKAIEPAAKPAATPSAPAEPDGDDLPAWLWGVVALLVAAAGWLGWRLVASRRKEPARNIGPAQGPVSELDLADSAPQELVAEDSAPMPEPEHRPARVGEMTMQVAAYRPAPQMESDASLTTQVSAGDPSDLRRRYIEERFPELANRTISLDDSDSIIKGARLFYEDGAHSRAIELLTFAIEERPGSVKLWLALFEIYRLEGMKGEFAELAGRFRSAHDRSEFWPKIQLIGREIDPQHPLYLDSAPYNSLETIGYTASRARDPRRSEFDPLAENWLNAPMDFMTDALASDLRRAVMAEHGVTDADIAPNPMSALKNVEVFGGN